jgi:hypothetical protein
MNVPDPRDAPSLTRPARPVGGARLRELPPFGAPDAPYPPAPDALPYRNDDPHGVFQPSPEERALR